MPIVHDPRREWFLPFDVPGVKLWTPITGLSLANDAQCTSLANRARDATVGNLANGGGVGATAGPLFKSSVAAFNNQPMLYWGAGNAADLESGTFTTIAQPVTWWIALQCEDNTATRGILENHTGTNRNLINFSNTGNVGIFAGTVLSFAINLLVPTLLSVEFNGASSKIYSQGVLRTTGDAGTNGPNGIVIGKDQDGAANNWRGWMAPPIMMQGIPSASQRARMDHFLNQRYRMF
jgi:hypothetical protein